MKVICGMPPVSSLKKIFSLLAIALSLSACVGRMSVPGGTENVNDSCFNSIADMQARVLAMSPGMPEAEVLTNLCRTKDNLTRLDRREIRIALLGGDNVLFAGMNEDSDAKLIQSLYGYTLSYKSLNRQHGFINPIRIQTDETGFNYNVVLIFRSGRLFAKPILSGGIVNNVSSGTIFDFITPGTFVNRIP